MVTLIFFVLIVFYLLKGEFDNYFDRTLYSLLFGSAIGFIISFAIGYFTSDYTITKEKTEIYSLSDNSKISGNFCLGAGHIEDNWVYSFYVKRNGVFYIEDVLSDKSKVIEHNG